MMAMFCFRSRLMILKRCSVSRSVREEVGSSMMMMRAFVLTARAISIIWSFAADRLPACAAGSTSSSRSLNRASVLSYIALWSTTPKVDGKRPSQTFSMTGRKRMGWSS